MSEVIDLTEKRRQRNEPDDFPSVTGPDGMTYYPFAVDYGFEGKTFTVYVWARNLKDAEDRAKAIRSTASVAGQIQETGVL